MCAAFFVPLLMNYLTIQLHGYKRNQYDFNLLVMCYHYSYVYIASYCCLLGIGR